MAKNISLRKELAPATSFYMYSFVYFLYVDISTFLSLFQDYTKLPMRVTTALRSFMRSVFLISFGITTLPKSSILLTTPIAFLVFSAF